MGFKQDVEALEQAIKSQPKQDAKISKEFRKHKEETAARRIKKAITSLKDSVGEVRSLNEQKYKEAYALVDTLQDNEALFNQCVKLSLIARSLPENTSKGKFNIKKPKLPTEIKDEVYADINELEKCYANRCYRACVILCGRVLETCLHRMYFEKTNNDLLEKSPGIGLGNIIAKLSDQGIDLDPALKQQVHLINQARIFSVHKKQTTFKPSQQQSQAIILYTMDIVGRMF